METVKRRRLRFLVVGTSIGLAASALIGAASPAQAAACPNSNVLNTTPGSSTCSIPSGIESIAVLVAGGGGGGGYSEYNNARGGKGGDSAYAITAFDVKSVSNLSVTVGAGGSGGGAGTGGSGNTSNTSAFGGAFSRVTDDPTSPTVDVVVGGGGGAGSGGTWIGSLGGSGGSIQTSTGASQAGTAGSSNGIDAGGGQPGGAAPVNGSGGSAGSGGAGSVIAGYQGKVGGSWAEDGVGGGGGARSGTDFAFGGNGGSGFGGGGGGGQGGAADDDATSGAGGGASGGSRVLGATGSAWSALPADPSANGKGGEGGAGSSVPAQDNGKAGKSGLVRLAWLPRPTGLSATPGDRSLKLAWSTVTPPAATGFGSWDPLKYQVYLDGVATGTPTTNLDSTVSGLTNNKQYEVTVEVIGKLNTSYGIDPVLSSVSAETHGTPKNTNPPKSRKSQKLPSKIIPKAIKSSGITVINPAGSKTIQGMPVKARVRATTQKRGQVRCLVTKAGKKRKLSVRTFGRCAMKVRVTYTAPGNQAYKHLKVVKNYRVKI